MGWEAPVNLYTVETLYPSNPRQKWVDLLAAEIRDQYNEIREVLLMKEAAGVLPALAQLTDLLLAYRTAAKEALKEAGSRGRKTPVIPLKETAIEECQLRTEQFLRAAPDARPQMAMIISAFSQAMKSKRESPFVSLARKHYSRVNQLYSMWGGLIGDADQWLISSSPLVVKGSRATALLPKMEAFDASLQNELEALEAIAADYGSHVLLELPGSTRTWEGFRHSLHHLRILTARQSMRVNDDFATWLKLETEGNPHGTRIRVDASEAMTALKGSFDELPAYALVLNLLKLARVAKATEVHIRLDRGEQDRIHMTVSYNGPGIVQDDLNADLKTTERKLSGTSGLPMASKGPKGGWELAIIRGAVESLQGTVQQSMQQDTRSGFQMVRGFVITFPLQPVVVAPADPHTDVDRIAMAEVQDSASRQVDPADEAFQATGADTGERAAPESSTPVEIEDVVVVQPPEKTPEVNIFRTYQHLRTRVEAALDSCVKDPANEAATLDERILELASALKGEPVTWQALSALPTALENKLDEGFVAIRHAMSDASLEKLALRDPAKEMVRLQEHVEFHLASADDDWVPALRARLIHLNTQLRQMFVSKMRSEEPAAILEILIDIHDTAEAYQAGIQRIKNEHGEEAARSTTSGMDPILFVNDILNPGLDRCLEKALARGTEAKPEIRFHLVTVRTGEEGLSRLDLSQFAAVLVNLKSGADDFIRTVSSQFPDLPALRIDRTHSASTIVLALDNKLNHTRLPRTEPLRQYPSWLDNIQRIAQDWEEKLWISSAPSCVSHFQPTRMKVNLALTQTGMKPSDVRAGG